MASTADHSHRTAVQKLGVREGQRVEVAGDVGAELRRGLREALERGLVRSGQLDGAIALVESLDDAEAAFREFRPRMHDAAYLWLITWKRGHERYLNQLALVPLARDHGLIDNKTCSIDDERSGIRFVVPRARRGAHGAREGG